jgi:hypothetical protein
MKERFTFQKRHFEAAFYYFRSRESETFSEKLMRRRRVELQTLQKWQFVVVKLLKIKGGCFKSLFP